MLATTSPDAHAPEKWADKATYGDALVHRYLSPLEAAAREDGRAPRLLQERVLRDLKRYFELDMRERSPTIAVTEPMAIQLHELMHRIMSFIDVDAIDALDSREVQCEVKHALLHYKATNRRSPVVITHHDNDQGLLRLSYYVHGKLPRETFLLDGIDVKPAFAKYRACTFFRRVLFRERIVWVPSVDARALGVLLDGQLATVSGREGPDLSEGPANTFALDSLLSAGPIHPPSKGGQLSPPTGLRGFKTTFQRWLARSPLARLRFANAWVFVDGDDEADDNAEHLYRWVRRFHPEINAWFLLSRTSADWDRLSAEGFRLMPEGMRREVLVLNSDHIISSHANYAHGGLDRELYGDLMRWRFTYLTHGVHDKDRSHWLNAQPFDRVVATTPAELSAIAGDDTPYKFSGREVRRTGLPRHDGLFELSRRLPPEEVNLVFVMPTWRARLNKRASESSGDAREKFAASEYARSWRSLLRSSKLRELVDAHNMKLAFMPHPGSVAYLEAFDIPDHVNVFTKKSIRIQQLFCRSAIMITDYSSVAFEMTYLRRPLIYYQFDRESFYHGDHDLREGYFSFERDGFGPVAMREDEVIGHLQEIIMNDCRPLPEYMVRMEHAMPERDGQACRRVFDSIKQIRNRVV